MGTIDAAGGFGDSRGLGMVVWWLAWMLDKMQCAAGFNCC